MRALLRTVTGSGSGSAGARTSKAKQPSTPSVEQIVQICTDIRNTLDGTQSQKVKTAESRVARLDTFLEALVDTLVTEASLLSSTETTGECMEYILTHDVLSTIVTASLQDSPTGALGVTLKAFGNLITLLGDTFIAYSHKPIITLIVGASGHTAPTKQPSSAISSTFPGKAYERELASLLCSLCARLKAHSELLPIFFSRSNEKSGVGKTSLLSPSANSPNDARTLHVLHSPLPSPSPSAASEASSSQGQKRTQDGFPFPSGSKGPATNSVKASSSSGPPAQYNFPILSILLTFLARRGQIGNFARQGILFLCELAHQLEAGQESASLRAQRRKLRKKREEKNIKKNMPDWSFDSSFASSSGGSVLDGSNSGQGNKQADLADYISKSDFADLLGASMGAVFSTLPRKVYIAPPGHSLEGLVNSASQNLEPTSKKIAEFDTLYQKSLVEQLHEENVYLTTEDEVQDGLSLLLKLVEFAQDVLKRVSSASVSGDIESKGYYLGSRIINSIKTALLENTLYPILQEVSPLQQSQLTSTAYPLSSTSPQSPKFPSSPGKIAAAADQSSKDYALLAVFYYIESLLDILDPDTRLAGTVLEFLVSKDKDHNEESGVMVLAQAEDLKNATARQLPPVKQHQRASQSISSIHDRRPRSLYRASTSGTSSLLTLHGAAHTPKRFSSAFATHHRSKSAGLTTANLKRWHSGLSIVSSSFDDDVGRNVTQVPKVNLRDLLFHILASSPPLPSSTSPLTSSSSIYRNSALKVLALKILHVIFTRFDVTSSELLQSIPDLGCTNFPFDVRKVLKEEEKSNIEDEGEFKYPTSDDDAEASDTESFVYPGEEGKTAKKASADKRKERNAQDLDTSEIALLLSLALPKGTANSSTDYSAYLKDAELAIQSDRSFQRGLFISSTYTEEAGEDTCTALSSALSSTSSSARTASKLPIDDPMLQHKLKPTQSHLIISIIDNLCDFFANTPEENLLLTALIARLASCPYRSLGGWLLPPDDQLRVLVKQNLIDAKKGTPAVRIRKISSNSDTSSASSTARKAPIPLFLLGSRLPPEKPEDPKRDPFGQAASEMPVFAILSQLCDTVDQFYANEITNFDRYLEERRKGMSFVEDLAEALEFTTDQPEDAALPISRSSTAAKLGLPTLVNSFSTPTKKIASSKKASKSSITSGGYTSQEGLSPYALHYTHTESVRVTPRKAVSPLSSAAHLVSATSPNLLASPSSDNGSDGGFDTPTKPSQHARSSSQSGPIGHRPKQSSISSQLSATSKRKRQMDQTVTLSMLLDNVIILEEAIKELIAIVVVRKRLGIDNVV